MALTADAIVAHAVIVLFPLMIIGFSGLMLVVPNFDIAPAELEEVSGFYGPGSVVAWLLLALSNTEFLLLPRIAWSPSKLSGTLGTELTKLTFDATMLGTAAFSAVAFVDLIVQTSKSFGDSPDVFARIQAPLTIMHLTSSLCVLAALPHALYWLAATEVQETELATEYPQHLYKLKQQRKLRLWTWICLFVTSQLGLSLYSSLIDNPDLAIWQTRISWFVPGVCFFAWALSGLSWIWTVGKLMLGILLVLWRMGMKGHVGYGYPPTFAFPRTACKISDLDQAAAMGVAVVTFVLPMAKSMIKSFSSKRGQDEGSIKNTDTHPTAA